MPVASQAAVKALTPQEVAGLGVRVVIANAYHLYLRPGIEAIAQMGGLHRFMGWDRPLFTDSGGFQAFSMGGLRKVKEEGLLFRSHIDGSEHFFTPEKAIECQTALGADLITCLDECIPYGADEPTTRAAMERTHRWARRCQETHSRADQALFAIIQGGHSEGLRRQSAEFLVPMGFFGYAIGGLSVGEPKDVMYRLAGFTANLIPEGKLRYLMGVGSPEDLVECVARGLDLFDCALPTRVARNGGLYTRRGRIDVTAAVFRDRAGPVEEGCDCYTCQHFSAAYIHHLFRARELLAYRLATIHNLSFYQRLMEEMRRAVLNGSFEELRARFHQMYVPVEEETRLAQRKRRQEHSPDRDKEEGA